MRRDRLKSQGSFGNLFSRSTMESFSRSSSRVSNDMSTAMARRTSTVSNLEEFQRRTSAMEDPLSLGKESESVKAPSRWLLVLGTTASGRTSIIRELKCAYDGFDDTEALRYVKEVHKTALDACRAVIKKLPPLEGELQAAIDRIAQLKRRAQVTSKVAQDLKLLWADKQVVEATKTLVERVEREHAG